MKIGILRPLLGVGGAEMTLVELAIHLERLGHEVWIHFDSGSNRSNREFNRFGTLAERVPQAGIKFFKRPVALGPEYVAEEAATTDLVITIHRHQFDDELLEILKRVPRRLVYVPGINPHHISGREGGGDVWQDPLGPIALYLFNSEYSLRTHCERGYPGLESQLCRRFHPPLLGSAYQRSSWLKSTQSVSACSRERFKIAVLGRLIPAKRPFQALEVLRNLITRHGVDAQIFFMGDGPLRKRLWLSALKRRIWRRVTFCGMLEQPQALLVRMDTVLHLCQTESFSRALRESMLLGCPTVSYAGGGNVELMGQEFKDLLFQSSEEASHILCRLAHRQDQLQVLGKALSTRMHKLETQAQEDLNHLFEVAR